jgi:hypothetical protein
MGAPEDFSSGCVMSGNKVEALLQGKADVDSTGSGDLNESWTSSCSWRAHSKWGSKRCSRAGNTPAAAQPESRTVRLLWLSYIDVQELHM